MCALLNCFSDVKNYSNPSHRSGSSAHASKIASKQVRSAAWSTCELACSGLTAGAELASLINVDWLLVSGCILHLLAKGEMRYPSRAGKPATPQSSRISRPNLVSEANPNVCNTARIIGRRCESAFRRTSGRRRTAQSPGTAPPRRLPGVDDPGSCAGARPARPRAARTVW
jgi:hypothetical protein